jgi:hypothetical protein
MKREGVGRKSEEEGDSEERGREAQGEGRKELQTERERGKGGRVVCQCSINLVVSCDYSILSFTSFSLYLSLSSFSLSAITSDHLLGKLEVC